MSNLEKKEEGGKSDLANAGGDLTGQLRDLSLLPDYIQTRQVLWEKFKKRADEELASKVPHPIKVEAVGKDGEKKTVDGESWKTSPHEVARLVGSKSWAESMVIAKVDGVLWDLDRPLEDSCVLELLKFDDNEGNYCLNDIVTSIHKMYANCLQFRCQVSRYSGTQQPTCLEKQWKDYLMVTCATAHPLKLGFTMTCSCATL